MASVTKTSRPAKAGKAKAKAKPLPSKTKAQGKPAAPARKGPTPTKVQNGTKTKASTDKAPDRSAPPMAEVDAEVLEFIAAIDRFKQVHGRPFPNWSEVLLVVRQLGYRRA